MDVEIDLNRRHDIPHFSNLLINFTNLFFFQIFGSFIYIFSVLELRPVIYGNGTGQ